MKKLIGLLNAQQWKVVGAMLLGSTGPVAWLLSKKLGLSDADTRMWLDFIAAVTPLVAGVFITAGQTNAAQVQAIVTMPAEDKAKALERVSAPALASIAAAFPDEAKVASILAMPAEATAAAVANLSEADQASIVAALPDKAVITAAGAMPDVEVKVGANASSSALDAAHDANVSGVTPA